MADEFDFSELRNYLSGQIDLGEAELLLDEPWMLTRKGNAPSVIGEVSAAENENVMLPPAAALENERRTPWYSTTTVLPE